MSTKKRTTEEQEAADEFHKQKCCTTKWIVCGIVTLVIGLILLVTAVGVYNAWDLKYFANATYYDSCYIEVSNVRTCNTESCTGSNACTQSLYNIRPDNDQTCADGECGEFTNGCVSNTYEGACAKQPEYVSGTWTSCYEYSSEDIDGCQNSGRLDDGDEWSMFFVCWCFGCLYTLLYTLHRWTIYAIHCTVGVCNYFHCSECHIFCDWIYTLFM